MNLSALSPVRDLLDSLSSDYLDSISAVVAAGGCMLDAETLEVVDWISSCSCQRWGAWAIGRDINHPQSQEVVVVGMPAVTL
jgi:hypothetical protein